MRKIKMYLLRCFICFEKTIFYSIIELLLFLHSIMKKLGNKFILIVILIIALIVSFQVYIAYSNSSADTNSYLTLVKGNGTLNELRLITQEEYIILPWDKIRVIWGSSLAVIKWWDGSLTRLWGNTKILIEQNEISRDYTNINISFDLIAWKTWSNVISFIGSDSSFTQTFDGVEAWVRGTVFDVDLDKGFLHVTDHLVELTDIAGNTFTVFEWKSLSLQDFSYIDVSEFIANLEDAAWAELNEQFDTDYIWELKEELATAMAWNNPFLFILEGISPEYKILKELNTTDNFETVENKIDTLKIKNKKKVYNAVLSKYQSMNFVEASGNYENYKRKIFYKKALILLSSSETDTQRLIQSSAYDLQDIIESQSTNGINETLEILSANKEILWDFDMSFLSGGLEYLPEGLLQEFKTSFWDISDIFNIDTSSIKDINTDSVSDLLNEADGVVQGFLDKNVGGLLQSITE